MARAISITQKQLDFIVKATRLKMSTREIAEQIGMSQKTVNNYQQKLHISKPVTPLLLFT